MRYSIIVLFSVFFLVSSAQNVGIGTTNPDNLLHLRTKGPVNTELKMVSEDTTGMNIFSGVGKPYLQRIYRNNQFDQGLLFYPEKAEIHTGWGKTIGGTYYPYPSLTIDDEGRTGVNMGLRNPSQTLDVNGKVRIGDDANNDVKGVIKYDGSQFMGYDGEGWKSLQDINDADDDTKVYLEEGLIDAVILQANGAANQLSYDGTRLRLTGKNIFIGMDAGSSASSGLGLNTAMGEKAGRQLSTGSRNTFVGGAAGEGISSGINNTMIGAGSGNFQTNGSKNTFLGYNSGLLNNGSNNVFLGYEAGATIGGSNKLYIANNSTNTPLIYGDFASNTLTINNDLQVSNSTTTQEIMLNGSNPKVSFESGGVSTFDIAYNSGADRLTISEDGQGMVLKTKDGVITLPTYAGSLGRNLVVNPDGSLSTKPLRQVFNAYDFGQCGSYGANNDYSCVKGVHFQDGQILSRMDALQADNASSGYSSISLFRRAKIGNAVDEIYKIISVNNGAVYSWYSDTTVGASGSNVIDNDNYFYTLFYYYYYTDSYDSASTREVSIE